MSYCFCPHLGPKGVSVPSMKRYIIENYAVDSTMLKSRLKKAITKGLSTGEVIRPKGTDDLGKSA